MRRNKKGVSGILAYVLLITLTIILAVMVTIYMKNKAKEQAETISGIVGTQMDCESVAINGYLDCASGSSSCDDLVVTNIGAKTVFLNIRYQTNDANNPFAMIEINGVNNEGLKPKPYGAGDNGDFKIRRTISDRLGKLEIIPMVLIKNKKVGCAEKKLVVE